MLTARAKHTTSPVIAAESIKCQSKEVIALHPAHVPLQQLGRQLHDMADKPPFKNFLTRLA